MYKNDITKGNAMEPEAGGVADIEMLRFPESFWGRMVEQGCLPVYVAAAHQMSRPPLVQAMLQKLGEFDKCVWDQRVTFIAAVTAAEEYEAKYSTPFDTSNLIPGLCRQYMKPSVVKAWAETEDSWNRLTGAVSLLKDTVSSDEGLSKKKIARVVSAFQSGVSGVGKYIAHRLFRSCCIITGREPPVADDWLGFDRMSDHEKAAFGALGEFGLTPRSLATALYEQHGLRIKSTLGLLVAVCEMWSLSNAYGGPLAAVQAIKSACGGTDRCTIAFLRCTVRDSSPASRLRGVGGVLCHIASFVDSRASQWKLRELEMQGRERVHYRWVYHSAVNVVRGLLRDQNNSGGKRKRKRTCK